MGDPAGHLMAAGNCSAVVVAAALAAVDSVSHCRRVDGFDHFAGTRHPVVAGAPAGREAAMSQAT